ncbi:hypothetical protein FOL47_000906 [Perkinsus chesapeaki]|uniref:Immunoglobulin super DCC subclass member n=1 Tax=Perkinsus chesapeaki TaxID=330153 RepID=A0A7J6N0T6_PERCH|nr:hypothetical protein FOL47_000906 [Perkinsus chesapeaki]
MSISPLSILLIGVLGMALADGKCTPSDVNVIQNSGKFNEFVYDCSYKTWGSGSRTSTCVQNGCGISPGCAACFGQSTSCGGSCAWKCAIFGKPSDQGCQNCLNSKGCTKALEACTGITNLPAPPSYRSSSCK